MLQAHCLLSPGGSVSEACTCDLSCDTCGFGPDASGAGSCLSCSDTDKVLSPLGPDGAGHCQDTRRNISTAVHKSFCDNHAILSKLQDRGEWENCKEGWLQWYDGTRAPQSVWEELVLLMWWGHPAAATAVGYEFWCNILEPATKQQELNWHTDMDVVRQLRRQLAMPEVGAVFYGFPHMLGLEGGDLEIAPPHGVPQGSRPEGGPVLSELASADQTVKEVNARCDECEVILPEYNTVRYPDLNPQWGNSPQLIKKIPATLCAQMVVFDVRRLHRVRAVTAGARFSFQVNVWKERPLSPADLTSNDIKGFPGVEPGFDPGFFFRDSTHSKGGIRRRRRRRKL